MTVLLSTSAGCGEHDTGTGHPERPARLDAVLAGVAAAGLGPAVVEVAARPATRAELERVHPPAYLDALERFCAVGGGAIDADTVAGPASWDAALLAAGAGPDAVARLASGAADHALLAVRPPGHHATATRAMGFCLLNNVAVTAADLLDRGERVAIIDWDAHHGNGTQDLFAAEPRLLYVSLHEHPLFPGTGQVGEVGVGAGVGTTVNIPLPAGATGDVYAAAFEEVVDPVVEAFAPSWLIVSCGFDGHRADPLTGLALTSGDYADLARRVLAYAPAGRRLLVLEGGYDLRALADSSAAVVAALEGVDLAPEPASSGGPGLALVESARRVHEGLAAGAGPGVGPEPPVG